MYWSKLTKFIEFMSDICFLWAVVFGPSIAMIIWASDGDPMLWWKLSLVGVAMAAIFALLAYIIQENKKHEENTKRDL